MKPLGKVSTEWSFNLAYAVGLIATDGCLINDGRHINFTSKDSDLIEIFRQCLGLKNSVAKKGRGGDNKKIYSYIQFGDVLFYRWLMDIGLTPRKSLTLGQLKIPKEFFFDFLRGCFDGDGTVYSYWDPRWRSSFMFYTAFTSGSHRYLEWLRDEIESLAGIRGGIKPGTRTFSLWYAKKKSLQLIDKMYYADNVPHLKRKFVKIEKIISVDREYNQKARVLELADSLG